MRKKKLLGKFMKDMLVLFLVLFAILASPHIATGIAKVYLHQAIAKAPGYVPAIPEEVKRHKHKGSSTTYSVVYAYQIAGTGYKLESARVSSEEEARSLALTPDMEVAYAQGKPEQALLRGEFDNRDKSESMSGAIMKGFGSGFSLVALIMQGLGFGVLACAFAWLLLICRDRLLRFWPA